MEKKREQTHYIESYQTHCRVPIVVTLYFYYTIIHSETETKVFWLGKDEGEEGEGEPVQGKKKKM